MSLGAKRDKDGDLWFETHPGYWVQANDRESAEGFEKAYSDGGSLISVEDLFGPLVDVNFEKVEE